MKTIFFFRNWSTARIVRLALGLVLVIYGLIAKDSTVVTFLGGFLMFQAVANLCCCGGGSCGVDTGRAERNVSEGQDTEAK